MLKQIQMASLAGLMALLPVVGIAQTCKPESIPASTPTSRFTDHADGTVTDTKTGLMWKKCSEGQTWNYATNGCDGIATAYTWKAALELAQTQGYGWRVPNIKELNSIVEVQCAGPAINLAVFPNTSSGAFLTSSSNSEEEEFMINFGSGDFGAGGESGNGSYRVRLVRDADGSDNGQCLLFWNPRCELHA